MQHLNTATCSLMLRIIPQRNTINIHARNLPLWHWWQHRLKKYKFQDYQVINIFKSSSSIKSCFIFLNMSIHHVFTTPPFHYIGFFSFLSPLTSMSKVKIQYINSSIAQRYNNLLTRPQASLFLYNLLSIKNSSVQRNYFILVSNYQESFADSVHHRYSPI